MIINDTVIKIKDKNKLFNIKAQLLTIYNNITQIDNLKIGYKL